MPIQFCHYHFVFENSIYTIKLNYDELILQERSDSKKKKKNSYD